MTLTLQQCKKCHSIIHVSSAAAATVASGLAQLPTSDCTIIVPIQVAMVISLGSVFGIELTKSAARATLASATSTFIGRSISQFLLGWIPVLGNILNATTAAGVTEVFGWAIANDFANQINRKQSNKK